MSHRTGSAGAVRPAGTRPAKIRPESLYAFSRAYPVSGKALSEAYPTECLTKAELEQLSGTAPSRLEHVQTRSDIGNIVYTSVGDEWSFVVGEVHRGNELSEGVAAAIQSGELEEVSLGFEDITLLGVGERLFVNMDTTEVSYVKRGDLPPGDWNERPAILAAFEGKDLISYGRGEITEDMLFARSKISRTTKPAIMPLEKEVDAGKMKNEEPPKVQEYFGVQFTADDVRESFSKAGFEKMRQAHERVQAEMKAKEEALATKETELAQAREREKELASRAWKYEAAEHLETAETFESVLASLQKDALELGLESKEGSFFEETQAALAAQKAAIESGQMPAEFMSQQDKIGAQLLKVEQKHSRIRAQQNAGARKAMVEAAAKFHRGSSAAMLYDDPPPPHEKSSGHEIPSSLADLGPSDQEFALGVFAMME